MLVSVIMPFQSEIEAYPSVPELSVGFILYIYNRNPPKNFGMKGVSVQFNRLYLSFFKVYEHISISTAHW